MRDTHLCQTLRQGLLAPQFCQFSVAFANPRNPDVYQRADDLRGMAFVVSECPGNVPEEPVSRIGLFGTEPRNIEAVLDATQIRLASRPPIQQNGGDFADRIPLNTSNLG